MLRENAVRGWSGESRTRPRSAPLYIWPRYRTLSMRATLQLGLLIDAYGKPYELTELLVAVAARLEELAVFTDGRAVETGREDFFEHAAIYRRDRDRVLATW